MFALCISPAAGRRVGAAPTESSRKLPALFCLSSMPLSRRGEPLCSPSVFRRPQAGAQGQVDRCPRRTRRPRELPPLPVGRPPAIVRGRRHQPSPGYGWQAASPLRKTVRADGIAQRKTGTGIASGQPPLICAKTPTGPRACPDVFRELPRDGRTKEDPHPQPLPAGGAKKRSTRFPGRRPRLPARPSPGLICFAPFGALYGGDEEWKKMKRQGAMFP